MLGNLEGGIKDYKKVLEFDPDNTIALCHIAYNYGSMNNHNKAVEYYTMALETNGAIKSFTGSNGETMAINRNLDIMNVNKDSDSQYNVIDCNVYFNRGIEYLEIGQFDNSIADFKKSLKSNNAVGLLLLHWRSLFIQKRHFKCLRKF